MLHALIQLTANPGPYTPPAITDAPGGFQVSLPLLLAVAFAVGGFVLLLADMAEAAAPALLGAAGLFVLGAFGIGTIHDDDYNKAVHAHEQSVQARDKYDLDYEARTRAWLRDEYNITTDPGSVHTLRAGGQMVASTANGQKVIQLVETTTHDLAVQVVGGDIIQPGKVDG